MEESSIIIELAKQVPGLAVLAYLWLQSMKVNKQTTDQFTATLLKLEAIRQKGFKEVSDECHAVQREAVVVMTEASQAISANSKVIAANSEILEKAAFQLSKAT